MTDSLQKQAESLGIAIDRRWSNDTLKQKIADAKEAEASEARDVSNPDNVRSYDVAQVNTSDAQEVPNIGVMRLESSAEIRARQLGANAEPSPADDPKAAHKLAVERAKAEIAPTPEFDTSDVTMNGVDTLKTRLLYDWWDGQGNRHARGEELDLALNEAVKLIQDGKAERADPLTIKKG
jgi:hypothetical protein